MVGFICQHKRLKIMFWFHRSPCCKADLELDGVFHIKGLRSSDLQKSFGVEIKDTRPSCPAVFPKKLTREMMHLTPTILAKTITHKKAENKRQKWEYRRKPQSFSCAVVMTQRAGETRSMWRTVMLMLAGRQFTQVILIIRWFESQSNSCES